MFRKTHQFMPKSIELESDTIYFSPLKNILQTAVLKIGVVYVDSGI